MITTILRTCARADLEAAYHYTANHLHVPVSEITDTVAVAYVLRHFEQGAYSGWDGWVEMLEADRR